MTGGRVVVLGSTGRNFAAGMSGGVAYVLNEVGDFAMHCNQSIVELHRLTDPAELAEVEQMIRRHGEFTDSTVADRVLVDWPAMAAKFVKVLPIDYRRMLETIAEVEAEGLSGEEALIVAFERNKNDLARVSGN